MTARYNSPSVEAIREDSEDESGALVKVDVEESLIAAPRRPRQSSVEQMIMAPSRSSTGRERERSRRVHKSITTGSSSSSRHSGYSSTKSKTTNTTTRSPRETSPHDHESDGPSLSHRRDRSYRRESTSAIASSSSSSSSSDEGHAPDHNTVLAAARAKLTSPSVISTSTSLTVSTNKSNGSSDSNSTVTQASVTKNSSLGKRPELPEAPMSPAVPDPPDVFAYLDNSSSVCLSTEHEDEPQASSQWLPNEVPSQFTQTLLPPQLSPEPAGGSSSSSFQGDDNFSEPAADVDTDRSSSPDRSIEGQEDRTEADHPTDAASAKIESQIAAARQRQNLWAVQSFGTPEMQRGSAALPIIPPSALVSRQSSIKQHSLPRAEKLPVTGYELLASRLTSYSSGTVEEGSPRIKPMYRKFEALNHRLLLHLQDEISELEEQLHRLDNADTQSRRADRRIIPASRRAAAHLGGELQWHKTDILGRIGYKLGQYNQVLSSFNSTQSLSPPAPADISQYREYLCTEHPIVDAETHFLDPAHDLVSICSDKSLPSTNQQSPTSIATNFDAKTTLQSLAIAIAVAVLVPILTFSVIPGFLGRMTVVSLVAGGVLGALVQSGAVGTSLLGRDGAICLGVYGGVMVVIAGVIG